MEVCQLLRRRSAWKAWMALFAAAAPLAAESPWLRLATSRFELYTNAGDKIGRETLVLFEQAHRAVTAGSGIATRATTPLRIFLFRSSGDFAPYRSTETALGYYLHGRSRDYVAIRYSGRSTSRIIFHEYVHAVLNPLRTNLPHWFEEGTAEFYSTTVTDGVRLYAGVPARDHLKTLGAVPLLAAETFLHAGRQAFLYSEREQAGVYYSQSWGLIHMLTMAPGYRERFPHFVALLNRKVPQEKAFALAFGKDPRSVLEDMSAYVRSGRLQSLALSAEPARFVRISKASVLPAEDMEPVLQELLEEVNRNR